MKLQKVLEAIYRWEYIYSSEEQLQEMLARAFDEAGIEYTREVRLNSRDRIDFMVGRLGVEVKIAGSADRVERQLRRYAEHEEIDDLLLVSSRVRLVPAERVYGDTCVHVAMIGGAEGAGL